MGNPKCHYQGADGVVCGQPKAPIDRRHNFVEAWEVTIENHPFQPEPAAQSGEQPCRFKIGERVQWRGQLVDMCQGTIMRITHPENSGYVLHLKISDDVDDFPISEQSVELSQMCPHGHTADIPCIECEPAYPTRNEAQPEPSAPDATAERLQQIAEREALATKGPWAGDSVTVNNWPSDVDQPEVLMEWLCNGDGVVHTGDEPYANAEHDGQFIAHARSDIPYLLKLVEELRQKINENRGKLICSFCGTIHSYDPEQEHGMVDAVLAHIEICEKSPLVQLLDANRENLNLKARAEKAEAERDSLYKRVEELTRQPITAEENAKLVTPPAKP